MTARKPEHPLIPADRVNGTDVVSKSGEKLGKIEDIAIEKVSGEVAYPGPWKLLKYDTEKHAYVAPLKKADLEKGPTIDETELSGWNDALSREDIYGYYAGFGVGPYWI